MHTLTMAAEVETNNAEDYKAALTIAQQTLRDAGNKVQLWSTSEILLKDAEAAAASGDFVLAVKLANEASLHAELAVATAEREKETWLNNVPK